MCLLVIGDVHGRKSMMDWAYENINLDTHILFLGDYVDSFDEDNYDIVSCLREAIFLKQEWPEHVTLLWGNHDLQYLFLTDRRFRCSGYRDSIAPALHELFGRNKEMFTMAAQVDKVLYTHAGVTNTWLQAHNEHCRDLALVVDQVNEIFLHTPAAFAPQGTDWTGNSAEESPIWVRPEALLKDMAHPIQAVGHTVLDEPERFTAGGNVLWRLDTPYIVHEMSPYGELKRMIHV
jgi:predicted phosphodiesterase